MAKSIVAKCGIYVIRNTTTGQVYVGSSIDIPKRWRMHLHELRSSKHHSKLLQLSWTRYGEGAFTWEVVEVVSDKTRLTGREQYWIDALRACDPDIGMNKHPNAWSPLGIKRSDETRRKLSIAATGRVHDRESVERQAAKLRGRKQSEETRAKASAVRLGKPATWNRRLTYDDAQEIRRLRAQGMTQDELAVRFGVTRNPIRKILAEETYTVRDRAPWSPDSAIGQIVERLSLKL